MLGYKQILPINVFITFCVFMFVFTVTPWWAQFAADSYPGHPETAAFFYILASALVYWNLGRLAYVLCQYNRRCYNDRYELEVNNFFFQFTPMIYQKLNRHAEFEEFNKLLRMACSQARQLIDIADEERRHGS